jgi:hypothetical protein
MRLAMETASCPDAGRLWVERALELAARLHAARAVSAAAATPLMTLGLPIAASATARSTTIPAMLMVWAGGQAALASAWAMAAERPAFSSSVDWERRAATGHGSERVGVSLGEPERDAAQFVELGDDAADRHLMPGVC